MGYIIKDTAALLTTKVTDAARKKMSEGTFNISYFQVGDSEVCYDCVSGDFALKDAVYVYRRYVHDDKDFNEIHGEVIPHHKFHCNKCNTLKLVHKGLYVFNEQNLCKECFDL